MEKLRKAERIRQCLRDLFGSRLVEHLEEEKFRQQSVYEDRLAERDAEIVRLRSEALRLKLSSTNLNSTHPTSGGSPTAPVNPTIHTLFQIPPLPLPPGIRFKRSIIADRPKRRI